MSSRPTTPDRARADHGPAPGLFGNRAFMLLWAAYGVSALGDHVSEMAVLKWMGALESSQMARLQAMMTFMFFVPFFVLGPFSGILADRLPRRALMIAADLIRAVIMVNFALLLAAFSPWGTVGGFMPLLLVGIFASLFSPARLALMPTLIREDQLVRANGMISGLGVIATMFGVLIGGWLAKQYAPQVAFTVDAATFVLSAVLLLLLRVPRQERRRQRAEVSSRALAEGVRYVVQHRRVAQLIGVAVIVWSCGALVRSTIPTLVRDVYLPHLRGDELFWHMGVFQAALGAGMLAGALILTVLGDALRSEVAITWSLAGIGVMIGLLSATALVPIPSMVALCAGGLAIAFSGVFAAGVMASYNALLQRIVPNRIRGRLFGLTDLCTVGGLLLATGLLGIPPWPNIDRWIGWILVGVAVLVLATAAVSLVIRLRSARFGPRLSFWWNLNRFYCDFWFRLKREGICTVPGEGPVIVVANHTCSIDPLLLIASTPHRVLSFLVAEEYAEVPIASRLIHMVGCIPVRRDGHDAAGTRAALRHLKAGNALGIFIEGRIPPPGVMLDPKDGAAMLALHSNAVVVPAHISGTRYEQSVVRAFFRRHRARVRFGKPIDLSRYWISSLDKATLARISGKFVQQIQELAERKEDM